MCTWPKPHEPFGYFLNDQTLRLSNGTKINAFVAHRHCMVKFDPKICQTSTFFHVTFTSKTQCFEHVSGKCQVQKSPHKHTENVICSSKSGLSADLG